MSQHPHFDTLVEKIRERRRHTPWREFVMEIASWCPLTMYRRSEGISRYPVSDRTGALVEAKDFIDQCDSVRAWREWSPSVPFFQQVAALWKETPLPRLWHFLPTENCDYCDTVGAAKDCYLTICAGLDIERVLYSYYVISGCSDVYNSAIVTDHSTRIYQSVGVARSDEVFYSRGISDSRQIWFSTNLIGCHHCLECDGLTNQSYCVRNRQVSPEEFIIALKDIFTKKTAFFTQYTLLPRASQNIGCTHVDGVGLLRCQNTTHAIFATGIRHGNNLIQVGNGDEIEQVYDCVGSATAAEHAYGNMGVSPWNNLYLSLNSGDASHLYYCNYCVNAHHCFGCVGIRNKSYCILNKEYPQEEWYRIVTEILTGMEREWTLGEFFPATMNPFYFNDTVAAMVSDITREEVVEKGFLWREWEQKTDIPEWVKTYPITEVDLADTSESVLDQVFVDASGNAWKVTAMELAFLRKYHLPLPERHWLERLKVNLSVV